MLYRLAAILLFSCAAVNSVIAQSSQSFEVSVTVTDASGESTLVLGVSPTASDASSAEDRWAPPKPPGNAFDARLINAIDGEHLFEDIRYSDSADKRFVLDYQSPDPSTLTLSWDPAALSGLGTFHIVDDIDGSQFGPVDMSTTSSLSVSTSTFLSDRLRIVVTPTTYVNQAPSAANDEVTVDEDNEVLISVLANDSDPDGDGLTLASASSPSNGSVQLTTTQITYTPRANFFGTDSFEYEVTDGNGGSASGQVTVNVRAVNDAPVALADVVQTTPGQTVSIDVLSNDSDVEEDALTVTSVSSDRASIQPDGKVKYAAPIDFTGTDTFVYTISDGRGGTASAGVSVYVLKDYDGLDDAVEDGAPNGGDGNNDGVLDSEQTHVASLPTTDGTDYVTLETPEDSQLEDVQTTSNPSPSTTPAKVDFPAGFLKYKVRQPEPGLPTTVTIRLASGTAFNEYWKYGPTKSDPAPHWYKFMFDEVSNTGAVIDSVNNKIVLHFVDGERGDDDLQANGVIDDPGAPALNRNRAPIVTSTVEDVVQSEPTPFTVDLIGLFADPDEDVLTYTASSDNADYVDVDVEGSTLLVTPTASRAQAQITVTALDDDGRTASLVFTVEVIQNAAPSAVDDTAETPEDVPVTAAILMNDSDPDGDSLSVSVVRQPTHGSASVTETNDIRYSPELDFNGADSLTYAVTDAFGGRSVAVLRLRVTPVNDAPRFPTGPVITSHEDNAEVLIGGPSDGDPAPPESALTLVWHEAHDPEGDPVTYSVQLSRSTSFSDSEMLFEKDSLTEARLDISVGTIANLLTDAGIALNEKLTLHQRIVAFDDSLARESPATRVTLVRGTVVGAHRPEILPTKVALHPNYPNPFNPVTTLTYEIPSPTHVTVTVYDALGRIVRTVIDENKAAGSHSFVFSANGLPSGTYFVRLEADGRQALRKVVLIE